MSAVLENLRAYWQVHLLLTLYTAMLVHHAVVGSRRTRGVADYYVGGRALGGMALGLSFFATYSSTNSFVGFAGQSYSWGIAWLLLAPFAVIASASAWLFVAPRLREHTEKLGSLTVPDYIGSRFRSEPARVGAAVIVAFASLFYMTAVYKGIGNLVEAFLDVPYEVAIGIVLVVVMAYTVAGGFISVVRTDAVQGCVMIVAAIVLFSGTVRAAGGLAALGPLRASAETAHLFDWNGTLPFVYVLGVLFAGTVKFVAEPRQLSRFYALESGAAIRSAFWVSTLAFALVYTLLVFIGLYARPILGDAVSETDRIVPTLLTGGDVFSPGAAAFLMVAMVAAAMSSLDSVLLVVASTTERDVLGVLRGASSESTELRNTRLWVVAFAGLTALLALRPSGGIVSLTVLSGALYAACFVPSLLLGLFWRRGDGAAVLASFAAGIAVLLFWPHLPIAATVHQIFPAVALSSGIYALLGSLRPPVASARLDALFEA